uniref:Uncharacterized protein n=1 Tax=viral metagenome TaxID=1070528 RepID=A0A6M3XNS9_9ZZZZ
MACHNCKRKFREAWKCSDDLWVIVSERHDGRGILCIRCFEKMAQEKGIDLYWECGAFKLPSDQF